MYFVEFNYLVFFDNILGLSVVISIVAVTGAIKLEI